MIDRFYNAFSSKGAHLLEHLTRFTCHRYVLTYDAGCLPGCLAGCSPACPPASLIRRPPGDVRCFTSVPLNGTTRLETKSRVDKQTGRRAATSRCFPGLGKYLTRQWRNLTYHCVSTRGSLQLAFFQSKLDVARYYLQSGTDWWKRKWHKN